MSKSSLNNGNPNMVQFSGDNININTSNPHYDGVITHPENHSFSVKMGGDVHMNISNPNPYPNFSNANTSSMNLGNNLNSHLAINPLAIARQNALDINYNNNNNLNQIDPNNSNKININQIPLPNTSYGYGVNNNNNNNNLFLNSNNLPNILPIPMSSDININNHLSNTNNQNAAGKK